MDHYTATNKTTRAYKNLEDALNTVLTEDVSTIKDVGYRWEKTFHSIFYSIANTFSRFFVSRIKSSDVTCIQSSIQRVFQKTDYVEKIRGDVDLQNSFLLGYCHASEQFANSYETLIAHEQDEPLKTGILSYKHMKPILFCLEQNFQMSHKELAKQIGVSDSALSNIMAKVQTYGIFNAVHVGKNKYYTLAYPNGEKALKLAKSCDDSPRDSTDLVLKLLNIVQDAASDRHFAREAVLKECRDMFFRYTTRPAECMAQVRDLFEHIHPKKASCVQLLPIEFGVSKSVTIFTMNVESERVFMDVVSHNLMRNIKYDWFVGESSKFKTMKDIIDYLSKQLSISDDKFIIENVRICIMSEQEMKSLLGNGSDRVIYDEEIAYSSNEEDIELNSEYTENEEEESQQTLAFITEHENDLQKVYNFNDYRLKSLQYDA